jgi:hypothetical protein
MLTVVNFSTGPHRYELNGRVMGRGNAPVVNLTWLMLGAVVGVALWWVVLYGAVLVVSVFTEDVGWSRAGVAVANVGLVLGCGVGLVRVRSARPLLVGAVVGLVAFWVLVAGLRWG